MLVLVNSTEGLQLSTDIDSDEWGQTIDFSSIVGEETQLKPITWSQEQELFLTADIGFDGRISAISDVLNNDDNANTNDENGYYIFGTIYATTQTDVTVELSPAVEVDEGKQGSGTYVVASQVWNEDTITNDNAGSGAEYAIRIGFDITILDYSGNATGESYWFIYEPNSDQHVDESLGYIQTASIDGLEDLVPQEQLITQTTSSWTEAYPVEKNVVIYSLGDFTTDTQLFTLQAGQYAQIDIYLWLEGQDVDCTNEIGTKAQIFANIQFYANPESSSGLTEIQ